MRVVLDLLDFFWLTKAKETWLKSLRENLVK